MAIQKSKYTGDPGLFGFLGGLAEKALGVASALPVIGGAATLARQVIFPGDARMRIPGASTFPTSPPGAVMPNFPMAGPGMTSAGQFASGFAGAEASQGFCPRGLFQSARDGMCRPKQVGPGSITIDPLAFLPGGRPLVSMAQQPQNGQAFQATTAMMAGKATGFPGYHWNKSGYFLMSGEYVAPGTKAVRNRRKNPANARATSNSIMRLKGAKRYAKSLGQISIRKKC